MARRRVATRDRQRGLAERIADSNTTPQQWASSVLHRLGIHQTPGAVQALVGWARAEGGHWNNDAKFNPLNTTQPEPGAGNTGSQGNIKVYRSWDQGIKATADTLRNGRYGGILSGLRAGDPAQVADAIAASPWGTSGDLARRAILGTPSQKGARPISGAAAPSAPASLERSDVNLATKTTFDQAGFDQAKRRALLAQVIAQRHGEHGVLFKTGLLSTAQPDASEFTKSALTSQIVRSNVDLGQGAASTSGRVSSRPGHVAFAAGADRPGVKTRPVVRSFLGELAGTVGGVTVGTGTNHNRLTVDGNVSDHWTGHAADLPVPVDSHRGDQVAYHALRLAGVPNRRAAQMAKQGGLFTLHPDSGPLAGHRVQVIWKTNQGGNHHNHVHVGIR